MSYTLAGAWPPLRLGRGTPNPPLVNACTIVARNYLAYARVLATSYAEHHPGRRLAVLITDGEVSTADDSGEPFEVLYPSQLALEPDEFQRMAGMYDATELATAVKPWVLRALLDRGEPAVFLDPDVAVFAPLDSADELARAHGIVLTPHSLTPIPRDGEKPSELDVLRAGVFNLGFIAVGERAGGFLDWWAVRLRRGSVMAPADELFVDQRLIDLVPAYFDHVVLRDPSFNVAYWNLFERRVDETRGEYRVEGRPLVFFHFSGFDPERPHVLSRHHTRLERDSGTVARLCRDYAERLFAAGHAAQSATAYGFASAAVGMELDTRLRRLYREAVLAADDGDGTLPPDAFDPAQADGFVEWVQSGGGLDAASPARRAAAYVASGPNVASPAAWVRLARRTMLRLLSHYDGHQRAAMVSLLDAIRDVDARSSRADERLAEALGALESRLSQLSTERGLDAENVRELETTLTRLERDVEAIAAALSTAAPARDNP